MSVSETSKHPVTQFLTIDEECEEFWIELNRFPTYANQRVILSSVEKVNKGSFEKKEEAIKRAQSLAKLTGISYIRSGSVVTAVFALDRYYVFQLSNPDYLFVNTELLGSEDTLQKASDKAKKIAQERKIEFVSSSNEVAAEMKEAAI